MKNVLVIGAGDVGLALYQIIRETREAVGLLDLTFSKDVRSTNDIIHICFSYKDDFVERVVSYAKSFEAKKVIVESTVRVGTCRDIQDQVDCIVFHSPVRGVHNELYKSLKTFTKFVSGTIIKDVKQCVQYYKSLNIPAKSVEGFWETTELGKLLSTMQYGVSLALADSMNDMCSSFGVDYTEAVLWFNETYNEGYIILGKEHVVRPALDPPEGKIGGHCVVPNAELLATQYKSPWLDIIKGFKE